MPGRAEGARAIALVGPTGTGKTALMEALLFAAGAIERQGGPRRPPSATPAPRPARTAIRSRSTSPTSTSWATATRSSTAPGSVEFSADADHALLAVDLALVVIDPDPDKGRAAAADAARNWSALGVPHALFVNKIDQAHGKIRDLLAALQPSSAAPLVARQIPIWNDDKVTGFVDLALERAFVYRQGQPSEQIDIPADLAERGGRRPASTCWSRWPTTTTS